jgi:hypothetical protein
LRTLTSAFGSVEDVEKLFRSDRGKQEPLIALIFSALGLDTQYYGFLKGIEPADVVCFAEDTLILIEYTEGLFSHQDKIAKLASRARQLADSVDLPHLAVLITSKEKRLLGPQDHDAARKERVCLVTNEGISELFRMTSAGASVKEVLNFLNQSIPPPSAFSQGV